MDFFSKLFPKTTPSQTHYGFERDLRWRNSPSALHFARYLAVMLVLGLSSPRLLAQSEKPKSYYLSNSMVLAPIDLTKLYIKEGLIEGNSQTLEIRETRKKVEVVESESLNTATREVLVKDTVFKHPIVIEKGFAYNVVQSVGTFTVIKFWPIPENDAGSLISVLREDRGDTAETVSPNLDSGDLAIKGLTIVEKAGATSTRKYDLTKDYFLAKTSVLEDHSVEFENKKGLWNIGLLVLPVKIRPWATEEGQFDFADGFSVGTTFSWTAWHNWQTDFTSNFLLYMGMSAYTADESKIKEAREDYKIATFSPAIGWMLEKNSVQLSILVGIDYPSGKIQQQWVYQNKPWIGIGIGIGLFKIGQGESAAKEGNKSGG